MSMLRAKASALVAYIHGYFTREELTRIAPTMVELTDGLERSIKADGGSIRLEWRSEESPADMT